MSRKINIGRFFFGWDTIKDINRVPAKGIYLFMGVEEKPSPSKPGSKEAGHGA